MQVCFLHASITPIVFYLWLFKCILSSTTEIIFRVFEHPKENTLVGNIYQSSNITEFVRAVRLDSVESEWHSLFRIDRRTGELFTTHLARRNLDRERFCKAANNGYTGADQKGDIDCYISMVAFINNRIFVKMKILIEDINDNIPTFVGNSAGEHVFVVNISETSPPGATKIQLQPAYDNDGLGLQTLQYVLQPHDGPFILSQQSNDGNVNVPFFLVLARRLDYEVTREYWLNLTACDGLPSQTHQTSVVHCASQQIRVNVLNENDEEPTFKQNNYSATVMETDPVGHHIRTVRAVDADDSPYNAITYNLFGESGDKTDMLDIDQQSGAISLARQKLKPGVYHFVIVATNNDGSTTKGATETKFGNLASRNKAHLSLTVLDTNDHHPAITIQMSVETMGYIVKTETLLDNPFIYTVKADLTLTVNENLVGPVNLAYFTVKDDDYGQNAMTNCSLKFPSIRGVYATESSPSHIFRLAKVNQLNEHVSVYRLIIKEMIDAESLLGGETLGQTIDLGNKRKCGKILNFPIICQDKGTPPLSSQMSIALFIIDDDEFHPDIIAYLPSTGKQIIGVKSPNRSFVYNISMREDAPVGADILYLKVHDNDSASIPIFRVNRQSFGRVEVNRTTGIVFLVNSFDYEQSKHEFIEIYVSEESKAGEQLKGQVLINIDVLDVNDIFPKFSSPPLVQVPFQYQPVYNKDINYDGVRIMRVNEELPASTKLGIIKATDADIGKGGEVEFFLIEVSTRSYQPVYLPARPTKNSHIFQSRHIPHVAIQHDGTVWSKEVLDRESTPIIDLLVGVRDFGIPQLTSYTSIRIVLIDVNDNAPKWRFPNNNDFLTPISLSNPVGTTVTRVRATDADDSEKNGLLTYSFSEKVNRTKNQGYNQNELFEMRIARGFFYIDKSTGEIKVKHSLHHLSDGFLDVWIQVTDNGVPPLLTRTKLVVYLFKNASKITHDYLYSAYKSGTSGRGVKLAKHKSLDYILASMNSNKKQFSDAANTKQFFTPSSLSLMIGGITAGIMLMLCTLVTVLSFRMKCRTRKRARNPTKTMEDSKELQILPKDVYSDYNGKQAESEKTIWQNKISKAGEVSPKHNNVQAECSANHISTGRFHLSELDERTELFGGGAELFHCQSTTPRLNPVYLNSSSLEKNYVTSAAYVDLSNSIPVKIVTFAQTNYPLTACAADAESSTHDCLTLPNMITSIVPVCPVPPDCIPLTTFDQPVISPHSTIFGTEDKEHLLSNPTNKTNVSFLCDNEDKQRCDVRSRNQTYICSSVPRLYKCG